MRRLLIAIGLVISIGTRVQELEAQSPISIGVGAGIAIPSSTFRDEAVPGWRALASLDVGLPELPTSLRVDAAYDRFGFRAAPDATAEEERGSRTIASVALSMSLGAPDSLSRFSPYALGGVTMSHVACAGRSGCGASQLMGWNAGIGLRFVLFGRRAFADARMTCVVQDIADRCYVPITAGLLFGAQGVNADEVTNNRR